MRVRLVSARDLRKGGPFIGPRGGLWADPQHTIAWSEKEHGKITPHNCPRCRGLGHIVSQQTSLEGKDHVTSAACRTCNRTGKHAFSVEKAKSLGLPIPHAERRHETPAPRSSEQLSLLDYRPPPKQESLFDKSVLEPTTLRKNLPVKEKITVAGLAVHIENPKGSVRRWYDPAKKQHGETKMVHPYGFIPGKRGADGDDIDAFVGPHRDSKVVVIINQRRVKDLRRFDEHKVMLGFRNEAEAKAAYLKNYDAKGPKLMGTVRVWSIDRFKRWLETGDTSEPAEKSLR